MALTDGHADGRYAVLSYPAPNAVWMAHPVYGRQLWAQVRLPNEKAKKPCSCCGQPRGIYAYRPYTGRGNRSHRICVNCIDTKQKATYAPSTGD